MSSETSGYVKPWLILSESVIIYMNIYIYIYIYVLEFTASRTQLIRTKI